MAVPAALISAIWRNRWLDFRVGQGGGGLVQDQHVAALGNAGGDLDQLLLADAQLAGRRAGSRSIQAHPRQQGGGIPVQSGVIDPAAAMRQAGSETGFRRRSGCR